MPADSSSASPQPAATSLESLIEEINDRGWLINNLFQLDNGLWQANLRSRDRRFTEFARDYDPYVALSTAYDLIETAKEFADHAQTYSIATPTSLSDLLSHLKPLQPIKRRV